MENEKKAIIWINKGWNIWKGGLGPKKTSWCFFLFSTANKRHLSEFDSIQHGEYFRIVRPLFKHWQYSQNHRQRKLQIWKSESDCSWELLPPSLNILKVEAKHPHLSCPSPPGPSLPGLHLPSSNQQRTGQELPWLPPDHDWRGRHVCFNFPNLLQ